MADTPKPTPVKSQKPIPTTRSKMQLPAKGLHPTKNFTETHLNRPSIEVRGGLAALQTNIEILNALRPFRDEKKTAYHLGVNAINAILHAVHDVFAPTKEELVCVNIHSKTIRYHPHQHFHSRADFGILRKVDWDSLLEAGLLPAYHQLVSAGELKTTPKKSEGPKQLLTYLGILSQALPTHVSLLGFSCWPRGYTLHYSSPSGVECSEDFTWNNLLPFLEYAYTLYCPPRDKLHLFFDDTIKLSPGLSVADSPLWDVTVDKVVYERCEVRTVGQPWHRMSWIVESKDHYIIKDQHRSDDSTFTEGELYDTLHKAGHAPGFAVKVSYTQIVSHGHHMKIKVNGCSRTKTRIVLATSGAFLHQCENLVKFCRVMYDVLEAHRHAVNQEVLHRDLSQGNILINPFHVPSQVRTPYTGQDRPRFGREILSRIKHAEPEALVIDFDNACRYVEGRQTKHNSLHERTGTPKYIARSVSTGHILPAYNSFDPMPELPESLAERYREAYQDAGDPLRTFQDTEDTTHGGCLDPKKFKKYNRDTELRKKDFRHRPRHDAESVFWCMMAFLMRALPKEDNEKGAEEDINHDEFLLQWECFHDHDIPLKSAHKDSRTPLLDGLAWAKILHHKLAFVAPMITELVYQVRPEYALLEPAPHPLHLHEAMQRIILKYADMWSDQNINLNTKEQRKIPISENVTTRRPAHDGQFPTVSGIPTGSKRDAGTAELAERPDYTSSKQEEGIEEANEDVVEVSQGDDLKRICLRPE
ncbi:hypothetical protein ONZ45_g18139 [Pleurotus djamor]|nr:hypothetical protein ONZ45_g18139 [Pleurotus djamor]